eukprot:TRINITY_DN6918_c0_g2_i1.p1 TRINITY_DN6918_c0_g2~~TRINITY_DN6918_c0_g2_i1.p1  ORF type:complete len:160 (+),score=32.96 TRINITY_DN6918_c0_g2_i1:236-715(+)
MSAYKQLDSNLEEASTLAAKSDIDLNRAREGTDTRLSTIHACGERTEPSGAENSLKTVMREVLERKQRLSTYEGELSNAIEMQKVPVEGKGRSKVQRKYKSRKNESKKTMEKTIISSINKLLRPKRREVLDKECLPSRPYVFKGIKTKGEVTAAKCGYA